MIYNDVFLKDFYGNIDLLDVSLSELFNSLEKYVTQKKYNFEVTHPYSEVTNINISFLNIHLPHLIGLSRNHHFGLSTYHSTRVFENLKLGEWDLDYLRNGDMRWFNECKDKIMGCFYLYQMMNNLNTKYYSSSIIQGNRNHKIVKRVERDQIEYIIIKDVEGIKYSLEFAEGPAGEFFPRSLKINDPIEDYVTPIEVISVTNQRIVRSKR